MQRLKTLRRKQINQLMQQQFQRNKHQAIKLSKPMLPKHKMFKLMIKKTKQPLKMLPKMLQLTIPKLSKLTTLRFPIKAQMQLLMPTPQVLVLKNETKVRVNSKKL